MTLHLVCPSLAAAIIKSVLSAPLPAELEVSAIDRLRALKRGEADIVLSTSRPTMVIAAAEAGRSAKYRYERKGARAWIVERVA